jgi:hypothetical protein
MHEQCTRAYQQFFNSFKISSSSCATFGPRAVLDRRRLVVTKLSLPASQSPPCDECFACTNSSLDKLLELACRDL